MTPRKTLDRIADGGVPAGTAPIGPTDPDRDALEIYRTLVERIPGIVYTAEPGSRSEEALNLLASWTATLDQAERTTVADGA